MLNLYVIIRIPKSGSSSLEASLKEALTPTHLFKIPMLANPDAKVSLVERIRTGKKKASRLWKNFRVFNENAMWHKINREIADGDMISGHIEHGSLRLTEANLRYITIIRNPLERFISEYKWISFGYGKRRPVQKLYHFGRPAAAGKSMNYYLDFLLDHSEIYKNPTTRYISGSASHPDPYTHLLNNYWHFGILERPDAFAAGFESRTGMPFSLRHINHSPTPSQIKLTPTQFDKFEELHDTDLTLYQLLTDKSTTPV